MKSYICFTLLYSPVFLPDCLFLQSPYGIQQQECRELNKSFISFSFMKPIFESRLKIHIEILCLNTVQSNVKCKRTNKSPFCQHAPDVTKWIWNRPIRFIRTHPLTYQVPFETPRSRALRTTATVQAIAQASDAYFAQRFTHLQINCWVLKERKKKFVFSFILTVSLLPYTSFVLERLSDHWLGLEFVSL